jgi:hypothetical protein
MKRVYIVDIDGTIADASHRLHFIEGEKKDWDGFFAACVGDKPIQDVIDVICAVDGYFERYYGGAEIVYLTGRPEKIRRQTIGWLMANGLPNGRLVMREDGDHRPDTQAKLELLEGMKVMGERVAGVFEDRPAMVRVWRDLGLTVFQMNHKEF